ncbi:DUF805 domain-containing protein [Kitasatospora sp. NPDC052896]|uniref:DUF805 domain-containing protein n=1 Tax=Kitasatospora sp. NPDC052896 TaxID=3364061 RepID=UPI0037CC03C1
MNWYLAVLRNYVGFRGRARRKEYWMFFLFNLIIDAVLAILGNLLNVGFALEGVYTLLVLLPSLAVLIRRLHDVSRTGWWVLIGVIPLVGFITLLVFSVGESQPGSNKYGPNPLPARV